MKKFFLSIAMMASIISCEKPSDIEVANSDNSKDLKSSTDKAGPSAEFRACYVVPVGQVQAFKNRLDTDTMLNNVLLTNGVKTDAAINSDTTVPNGPFILFTNNIQVNVTYVDLVLQIPFSSLSGNTPAQIQASLSQKVQSLVDLTRGTTSIFTNGNEKPAFFGLRVPTSNGLAEVKINKVAFKYPILPKIDGIPVITKFLPSEFEKHTVRIENVIAANGGNPVQNVKSVIGLERITNQFSPLISVNNYLEFDLIGLKSFFRDNKKYNVIAGTGTDQEQDFGSEAQLYYPLKRITGIPLTGSALVAAQKANVTVLRGAAASLPSTIAPSDIYQRNQFTSIIIQ